MDFQGMSTGEIDLYITKANQAKARIQKLAEVSDAIRESLFKGFERGLSEDEALELTSNTYRSFRNTSFN